MVRNIPIPDTAVETPENIRYESSINKKKKNKKKQSVTRWRIGDFGECSTTCGGGYMYRKVRCIKQVDITHDRVVQLPNMMCEQPMPLRVRECNTQYCPANWASGLWSTVSFLLESQLDNVFFLRCQACCRHRRSSHSSFIYVSYF